MVTSCVGWVPSEALCCCLENDEPSFLLYIRCSMVTTSPVRIPPWDGRVCIRSFFGHESIILFGQRHQRAEGRTGSDEIFGYLQVELFVGFLPTKRLCYFTLGRLPCSTSLLHFIIPSRASLTIGNPWNLMTSFVGKELFIKKTIMPKVFWKLKLK